MKHCPNYNGRTLRRISSDGKRLEIVAARCKSWGCPYCAPLNARKLGWTINENIKRASQSGGYEQMLFVTLTADEHSRTAAASWAALHKAWPVIKKWLERAYGKFSYVFIFELHKSEVFHAHLIMLWRITPPYQEYKRGEKSFRRRLQRNLKDNARRWKIGYILDVREIQGGVTGIAKYISKQLRDYLGKGGARSWAALPARARLYMVSRDFLSAFASDDESGFTLGGRLHIQTIFDIETWDIATRQRLTTDDFGSGEYWPPSENAAQAAQDE